jgi:hypothetical protein
MCENAEEPGLSDRVCLQLGFDYVAEADYRGGEADILSKIAAAAEGLDGVVGWQIANIMTSTAALAPMADAIKPRKAQPCTVNGEIFELKADTQCPPLSHGSRGSVPCIHVPSSVLSTGCAEREFRSDGHRLVLDFSVKVPKGNFETIVLAKKDPAQPLINGLQSDAFHTALCSTLKHVPQLTGFKCEHLHVYGVNCQHLRSPPVLDITGDETLFVEASSGSFYTDQGATCTDSVNGQPVSLTGSIEDSCTQEGCHDVVNLSVPGEYHIQYTCTNTAGIATTKTRLVVVHHKDCPACSLIGESSETIEASFPFVDHATLKCADFVKVTKTYPPASAVDVETAGTYTLTYSATDALGNSNTKCGGPPITREVIVVDTLRPVIGLHYNEKQWWPSRSGEISPTTGRQNPIYRTAPLIHAAKLAGSLMAVAGQTHVQQWGFMLSGAVAAVALLATAMRPTAAPSVAKPEEAMPVVVM